MSNPGVVNILGGGNLVSVVIEGDAINSFVNTDLAVVSIETIPVIVNMINTPGLQVFNGENQTYTHIQNIAAAIWTVAHNLNTRPKVTVCDHLDRVIEPDIEYIDANIVRITHASAITGFVYCN